MKWVTRSHVHVDRVACPWLITRFIDNEAEFLFVPKGEIERVVQETGAIPFDAPGVELGHHGIYYLMNARGTPDADNDNPSIQLYCVRCCEFSNLSAEL